MVRWVSTNIVNNIVHAKAKCASFAFINIPFNAHALEIFKHNAQFYSLRFTMLRSSCLWIFGIVFIVYNFSLRSCTSTNTSLQHIYFWNCHVSTAQRVKTIALFFERETLINEIIIEVTARDFSNIKPMCFIHHFPCPWIQV